MHLARLNNTQHIATEMLIELSPFTIFTHLTTAVAEVSALNNQRKRKQITCYAANYDWLFIM